jgi:RNA polymerase sigma factor (sigma-70 family)
MRDDKLRKEHTLATFLAHRTNLVAYATNFVGCRGRAEDVVQEAWLRYAEVAARRPLEQPIGYLYRIVRNQALDVLRRNTLEQRHLMHAPGGDPVADTPPSPEDETRHRQDLGRVMAALAELPDRTRIALEMHRFGGHRLKDIAAHLGISIGLAHALVREGLEHCRRRVNEER